MRVYDTGIDHPAPNSYPSDSVILAATQIQERCIDWLLSSEAVPPYQ